MRNKNFWVAVVAAGVVANILDFVVHGQLLQNMFYGKMESMKADGNPIWFVLMDFTSVGVFTWFYSILGKNSFQGMNGGMKFGLYAGVLVNFPAGIAPFLMTKGFPYELSWIWIVYGIIWYAIIGMVVGKVYGKAEAAAV